jgi:hypothetical protein
MRPVGFGNLFIYLFLYFIHDIVYPYTTRGWKILDYSTCCRKYHSIYDLVVFPGNTSRIIENFQSSRCIIYWVIQNDCGQVWQLCTKIYVATVWGRVELTFPWQFIVAQFCKLSNQCVMELKKIKCTLMKCHTNVNSTPFTQLPHTFSYIVAILGHNHFESPNMTISFITL